MAANSDLFVKLTPLFEINGQSYFPTSLVYTQQGITTPALMPGGTSEHAGTETSVSEFKIRLGQHAPGTANTGRKIRCADGKERSAFELTKDYIELFVEAMQIAPKFDSKARVKFMVAEPLKFEDVDDGSGSWLPNYRANIRRILEKFGDAGFLPEPFAVYQYYRYGQRHPELAAQQKHVALILDFGGGTFDVCVIESTENGDIAQAGKHSRPFGAASVAFGGFKLNRELAEFVLYQDIEGKKASSELKKNLSLYDRCKRGEQRFDDLGERKKAFLRNFDRLLSEIEDKKRELVQKIGDNWSLNSEAYESVYLDIPVDMLSLEPTLSRRPLYAHNFRDVFVNRCWKTQLKPAITKCLRSANELLKGKDITCVLMSGGSANIKWLAALVQRDFGTILEEATVVDLLQNYQDIVARGLAIECARRMHEPDSEFVGVSYNPLRLRLSPDGADAEQPSFKSNQRVIDMDGAKPGDLIPSATSLKKFIDQPVSWKFKLSKEPSRELAFEFMTMSDNEDFVAGKCDQILNISNKVFIRKRAMDSRPSVEVRISEDGTIHPRFIFQKEDRYQEKEEYAEVAAPFTLDMTALSRSFGENASGEVTYIGFDFGTSYSSISRISNRHIQKLEERNKSKTWRDLADLPEMLPYPVSTSLKRYLAKENPIEERDAALELLESCLAVLAYAALVDAAAAGNGIAVSGPIRSFIKKRRSFGPLMELLRATVPLISRTDRFGKRLRALWARFEPVLNEMGKRLNDAKHHKGEIEISEERLSELLNEYKAVFDSVEMGQIGECNPSDLEEGVHEGTFFVANGVPPFHRSRKFRSDGAPMPAHAMLLSHGSGELRSMFPFALWYKKGSTDNELYLFDSVEADRVVYKSVSGRVAEKWSRADKYGAAVFRALEEIGVQKVPYSLRKWAFSERSLEHDVVR